MFSFTAEKSQLIKVLIDIFKPKCEIVLKVRIYVFVMTDRVDGIFWMSGLLVGQKQAI